MCSSDLDPEERCVQVLALCPTRELAVQICREVDKLALFMDGVSAVPIYGGSSFRPQLDALRRGVQFVVGTPGRVMDLMESGALRLDGLRMLILDEADEMLDMGFLPNLVALVFIYILKISQNSKYHTFTETICSW